MFGAIMKLLTEFQDKHLNLSPAEQEAITNAWGREITTQEPAREDPNVNRSQISCNGRGNTSSVSVITRGNTGYIQTAVFAAEAVRRVLGRRLRATGFASPAAAFGARELLAAQAEGGYLSWTQTSV
jgi:hypothetical protein